MTRDKQTSTPKGPRTQAGRRVAYGLNVAVAIVVAVAITGVVNYIGYNYLFKYRKDVTATGEYSLSPQTRKVVAATQEPVKIISLLGGSRNPEAESRIGKARGLVDEYGYINANVTVQHIDPASEPDKLGAFYKTIRQRYADRLDPMGEKVTQGLAAVGQTKQAMADMTAAMRKLLDNPSMPQGRLPATLTEVTRATTQMEAGFDQYQAQITKAMDRPLADYSGAAKVITELLDAIDQQLFAQAVKLLEPYTTQAATPDAIKNDLLKLLDQFKLARSRLRPQVDALKAFEPMPEYDQLYLELANPNVVVVVGPSQVTVVPLEQMFRAADAESEIREPQFLGEEKITGALLGMQQKAMPMVVFISSPRLPAMGPQGLFRVLAQQLENMRFRVEEWSPQGRPGPMGQMLPPGEPPKAEPGQKAVWVVLPMEAFNPMMPMQSGGGEKVISLLQERTHAGDGVLVMLNYAQGARVGVPDPLALWAQEWGIHAMNDRMILRELLLPDRTTRAVSAQAVSQWPKDLPITQALSGFSAVFAASSPIEITPPATEDDKLHVYPLVEVRGQGLWAERDPTPSSKKPADVNVEKYLIAAAAQRDESRLVLVADPAWATDQFVVRTDFPGNAELFVNSVYWLSGLERMIAASARTQDIRRVGDISPGSVLALRWAMMLGMPLVVAGAGMGVWLVRRRG